MKEQTRGDWGSRHVCRALLVLVLAAGIFLLPMVYLPLLYKGR